MREITCKNDKNSAIVFVNSLISRTLIVVEIVVLSANIIIIWRDRIGIDGILMIVIVMIVDVDSTLRSRTVSLCIWRTEDVQAACGTSLLTLKP